MRLHGAEAIEEFIFKTGMIPGAWFRSGTNVSGEVF
jgi:hypothetical protein